MALEHCCQPHSWHWIRQDLWNQIFHGRWRQLCCVGDWSIPARAVSQGAVASGPGYTYCSGDVRTTVDYILMDVGAASMMASCSTHPMADLNTSDHLPLTVCLS